ncbi:hypothetical protein B0H13DRAFT_1852538 [Mycena leptocephala]|nr:hypothetical protein B0H13DRAFT_1852538 [Mycena leptocephala]
MDYENVQPAGSKDDSRRGRNWSGASMDAGSAGVASTYQGAQTGNAVDAPTGLDDAMEVFEEGGRTEEQRAGARTGTRAAPTASNAYAHKVALASNRELESTHTKEGCRQVGSTADNQRISYRETSWAAARLGHDTDHECCWVTMSRERQGQSE